MKSAVYLVNSTAQTISDGGNINLGNIVRRFGQNVNSSGSSVSLYGTGYYEVKAYLTLVGTTADTVTVTLYKDGVSVAGANASVTLVASTTYNMSLGAIIKECCCKDISNLTLVVSGAEVEVTNIGTIVEKI